MLYMKILIKCVLYVEKCLTPKLITTWKLFLSFQKVQFQSAFKSYAIFVTANIYYVFSEHFMKVYKLYRKYLLSSQTNIVIM